MDKITGISNSSPVPESRKTEKPGFDLFKQSLDAAQAKKTAVSGPTQAVKSLGEVAATTLPQHQSLSPAGVIQKTDRLLDLLDNYSKDIDDPEKTLKDIEPLIDTIKKDESTVKKNYLDEANLLDHPQHCELITTLVCTKESHQI